MSFLWLNTGLDAIIYIKINCIYLIYLRVKFRQYLQRLLLSKQSKY